MSKLTAEEIWTLALEPDIDEEFERVLAMTDDEVRASLRARGRNVRMLEVEAMVLFGLPRKRTTGAKGFFVAGAATFASATAGFIMLSNMLTPMLAGNPVTGAATGHGADETGQAPVVAKRDFRQEGLDACKRADWQTCLDLLDRAQRKDPEGDKAPEVIEAREQATRALSKSKSGGK
jgi:hypothetical protein